MSDKLKPPSLQEVIAVADEQRDAQKRLMDLREEARQLANQNASMHAVSVARNALFGNPDADGIRIDSLRSRGLRHLMLAKKMRRKDFIATYDVDVTPYVHTLVRVAKIPYQGPRGGTKPSRTFFWIGPSIMMIVASIPSDQWDSVFQFWERKMAFESEADEATLWLDVMQEVARLRG